MKSELAAFSKQITEYDSKKMNSLKNDLALLNDSVNSIVRKTHEACLKQEAILKETKGRFNIFTTLLNANDETKLHSRFLGNLLNPDGNHDCGKLFLNLFIESVSKYIEINSKLEEDAKVHRILEQIKTEKFECLHLEYGTKGNGNIDILLEFENHFVVIENKIWAGEQANQIERYVKFVENSPKKGFVIYLTLDGKKSNTANGKEYYRISYKDCILDWLEHSLRATYRFGNINFTIQQYRQVINQLTNNCLEAKYMDDIKEIVLRNPAILKYWEQVNKAQSEVRLELIDKLMQKISSNLEEPFSLDIIKNSGLNGVVVKKGGKEQYLDTAHIFLEWNCRYLYMGISINHKIDEDKNDFVNEFKDKLSRLTELCEINRFPRHEKLNIWWPIGTYRLVDGLLTDEFVGKLTDSGKLESEAKVIANKVNQFAKLVVDNWHK